MGLAEFTVHGFRSSFRDWAGEATEFPQEIAETSLAHVVGNAVERAYRRGDALERRRALMLAWESYCLGKIKKPAAGRADRRPGWRHGRDGNPSARR
jgi:hypothetical protein